MLFPAAVVLQMYCLLYRIETGKEPNVASYLVTNAVFVLGFFTLALLLGEHRMIVFTLL